MVYGFTHGSLSWTGMLCRSEPLHLGQPVWNLIIQSFIYRIIYYSTYLSEGTVRFFVTVWKWPNFFHIINTLKEYEALKVKMHCRCLSHTPVLDSKKEDCLHWEIDHAETVHLLYIDLMLMLCINFLRSSHRRCSVKKGVLRNFANFTGKHLQANNFFKRDSNTGVFLWNLQNFWEHLFWRTFANDCFFFLNFHYHQLSCRKVLFHVLEEKQLYWRKSWFFSNIQLRIFPTI